MPLPVYARSAAVLTLSGALLAACAVFDALAPPGPRAVSLLYAGDTVLTVGERKPLVVSVLADGVPLEGQRLLAGSSNSAVLTFNTTGDSLVPVAVGKATLFIRLVHSSAAGTAMPDTTVELRVSGGPP